MGKQVNLLFIQEPLIEMMTTSSDERPTKKMKIRSSTEYHLIGPSATGINGSKLPTLEQVLKFLMHKELFSKTTAMNFHIANAVEFVLPFWLIAGIKTTTKRRAEGRLKQGYDAWGTLCKNKKRPSDLKGKRKNSIAPWDIGAVDAIEVIQKKKVLSPEKKIRYSILY